MARRSRRRRLRARQRRDDLRDAFSPIPPYLRQDAGELLGTFAEYGFEQTRPFRAPMTWATLVEREPELELAAAPETSIVPFRARPAGLSARPAGRRQPARCPRRSDVGPGFVTGTVFGGRETLRGWILHRDTGSEDRATLSPRSSRRLVRLRLRSASATLRQRGTWARLSYVAQTRRDGTLEARGCVGENRTRAD
jgi:aromatic-L-amino-acid decarboxylase